MLRLNDIQVIYSGVILVVKGLSLEVPEGQIVALPRRSAASGSCG
jgi:branched-chain amino acid transport system ATP-binding protein